MIVTLLTDFGRDDLFVGVCHAVILAICPDARIIDLTHSVPRHDVRAGATGLRDALGYTPVGIHVAVVDPGVGSGRRALAMRTGDGRALVGPDNGLLSLAWERAGGVGAVVDVSRSAYRLERVSATFHGRDVFAPVAAHLAAGVELADVGEPIDPASLARVELPAPRREAGSLLAHVLTVDAFGNATLDATFHELAGAGLTGGELEVDAPGGRFRATTATTFADAAPGETIVYEDSFGALAIAINRGDAATLMQLGPHLEVRLSRP